MLDHNMCKKLKDAGFLQPHALLRNYYTDEGHIVGGWQIEKVHDDFLLIPTLSDLIEACKIPDIKQGFVLFYDKPSQKWFAGVYEKAIIGVDLGGYDGHYANNVETAVANLWLALNEKKV